MIKIINYIFKTIFQVIGFESIFDFFKSIFVLKTNLISFHIFSFSLSGIIIAVESYTEAHIYKPFLGMEIFFATSVFNTLLGIGAAKKLKKELSSDKFVRSIVRFIIQSSIVALVFNMNKAWDYAVAIWMVDSLLMIFVLSTLWSAIKNAKVLEYITEEQFEIIDSMMNIKKLLNKFKKTKKEDD